MRRLLILVLPALLGATRAPRTIPPAPVPIGAQDQGRVDLATDSEARWVPFDLTPGNQIRFTMTIDGHAVTAILDTGVSFSLLARTSAAVVPAAIRPGGHASAIGGAVAVDWMPTSLVAFGGLTRTAGGVTVADLPAIATGSATAVDMLVGRDLLAGSALDIDYAGRRFRILQSGRMPFQGAVAPLRISPDRLVYESAVTLGERRMAPMVVDTGDGSAITVTDAGWKQAALAALPTTTAISFGLAGPAISGLAIVPEIRLGQLVARSAEVRIEPAGGFSQSIGVAGRIGSGFLQGYRILLDPNAGRMILSPGKGADVAPLRSTSGLLMGVETDRLKVLHVMRGGPAEASGWKVGDLVCTIDGTPVPRDYATSTLAAWSVGTPGRVVVLNLCDGTQRRLMLRQFY